MNSTKWFSLTCPDCHWGNYLRLANDELIIRCPHCKKNFGRKQLEMLRSCIGGIYECSPEKSSRIEKLNLRDTLRDFADKLDREIHQPKPEGEVGG